MWTTFHADGPDVTLVRGPDAIRRIGWGPGKFASRPKTQREDRNIAEIQALGVHFRAKFRLGLARPGSRAKPSSQRRYEKLGSPPPDDSGITTGSQRGVFLRASAAGRAPLARASPERRSDAAPEGPGQWLGLLGQ